MVFESYSLANSKWIKQLSLLGACLCTLCGGVVYSFSLFGPQLAAQLHYSATQLNLIAIAGNLGVFISSPLFGHLADTYHPSMVVKASSILFIFGFFGMALTFDGILPYQGFGVMALYYFLVGTAGGCAYINATSTSGHNFRTRRGLGIGLPVTFFGISAFVFSIVNHRWFVDGETSHTSDFLRFLGITTATLSLIGSFFLVKVDRSQVLVEESQRLRGPLATTYQSTDQLETVPPGNTIVARSSLSEPDIGGWDLVYNFDAQMLFLCVLFIGGSGLVYINNIGIVLHTLQMVDQVDNLPELQSLCVSMLSLFNCGGRLLFTALSDWMANLRYPIRRVSWLITSALIVGTVQFFAAYASAGSLILCSMVLGLGYGMMFAVAPTMTSVWFGTRQFGTNWGLLNISPAIGGQFLSLLFGAIYDSNLDATPPPLNSPGEGHLCLLGARCYRTALFINGGLCFLAAGLAYLLKRRRDAFY